MIATSSSRLALPMLANASSAPVLRNAGVPRIISQRLLLHTSRGAVCQQQQQQPPPTEPRNEALEYLEAKRLRKETRAGQPPSRHKLFYTDIIPPMLRILAYGSSAYFALHLLWNLLDRDEQRALAEAKTDGYAQEIRNLDQQIERASSGVAGKVADAGQGLKERAQQSQSSWKSWLWPFAGGGSTAGSETPAPA